MSIRRKEGWTGQRQPLRPPLESCIDAEQAMQESREAVKKVFAQTAADVEEEIMRARAVFAQAEGSMAGESAGLYDAMTSFRSVSQSAFGKASTAAAQGENAARAATGVMMERLNQISASLANAANQAPSTTEPAS